MKRTGDILLKSYSVSVEIFDEILLAGYDVRLVPDKDEFYDYKFGYDEKTAIVYDGLKCMIMLECILNEHAPLDTHINYWKQCIVYKNMEPEDGVDITAEINGADAYRVMKSVICDYYTDYMYKKRLSMFEAEYDEAKAQYHFLLLDRIGKIVRYDNCYKWDINGAHNAALCEIFPEAAPAITKMYEERKLHPENKKYVNYYCGMLCPKGYRKTYNWIVQRTTDILLRGIDEAGGDLIYANTDGFIIQNPTNILPHTTELGGFKLEYVGPVWVYHDKNYQCYQLETKEIKGNVLNSVRDKLDLPNGVVVHYDRMKKGNTYIAENIKVEVLPNGKK